MNATRTALEQIADLPVEDVCGACSGEACIPCGLPGPIPAVPCEHDGGERHGSEPCPYHDEAVAEQRLHALGVRPDRRPAPTKEPRCSTSTTSRRC